MELEQAIRGRRSIKTYDSAAEVDDETLRRLFELVSLTPSSFNLQHWRYVVVRGKERRERLRAAAFGQPHVGAAPAVVVICSKLDAHEDAARANGHAPPEVLDSLVPMIEGIYGTDPQKRRDEAIRSGSLAAMTLMLVAHSMGLATCPMIGFDPVRVGEVIGLEEGFLPMLLVTLGRRGEGDLLPTSRFGLDETVMLETFGGPGL